MGRKIPVLSLQTGEWRGIANGAIAEPEQAFGYVGTQEKSSWFILLSQVMITAADSAVLSATFVSCNGSL